MRPFLIGDRLAWLLSAQMGREKLALLVLCALTIDVLAAHLSWRLFYAGTGHRLVTTLARSVAGHGLAQVARVLYYAGIPFAVLWRGGLNAQVGVTTAYVDEWESGGFLQLLGLNDAQAMDRVTTGVAVALGTLCLLIAVWVWYARAVPGIGVDPVLIPWWTALREAILVQMLWALYRGFVATLTTDPVSVALVSLALITLGWTLNPWRRHLLFTSRGVLVVRDWICALFTAFSSLMIHALWWMIVMHTLWIWVSGRVLARLSRPSLGAPGAGQ
ncbi:MAG: hypothetical protein ISS56_20800 [Anaerolineae bacterium]|nr:hypothetical protein [Anaerolineae bacterium]